MTPKDRVTSVLSGRLADRVPIIPMVAGDYAAKFCQLPLEHIYQDGRLLGQALVSAYRYYGLDSIIVFSDVAVEAEAIGAKLEYPENSTPYVIEPPKQLRIPNPKRDGRMPLILEATCVCLDAVGDEATVFTSIKGPFSLATLISEPESFLSSLLSDPTAAHGKLEFATNVQLRYIDAILSIGNAGIMIGDPFATGSMIGPGYFEKFALPYLRALVEHIHARKCPAILHICGNTAALLPLIPETGADCFSVDEISLLEAHRALRGKMALMGNVSTHLLRDGAPDDVYEASRNCLQQSEGWPFVLSSACDVPMDTPEMNLFSLVRAAKHWSIYERSRQWS